MNNTEFSHARDFWRPVKFLEQMGSFCKQFKCLLKDIKVLGEFHKVFVFLGTG
jgi:hypothetical protein